MPSARLLIIDDEDSIRMLLKRILKLEGYTVDTAATGREGLEKASSGAYHVVICDVRLPDADGIELTRRMKEKVEALEVIQLTAHGNIADGVRAVKNGAFDYITKGDDNPRVLPLVERAAEKARAQFKLRALDRANAERHGFNQIVGSSQSIKRAISLAKQVAPTDTTVLVTGPTGTGKEVFAHAIHYASGRKHERFVAINCAAFSRELLESEMFGHAVGAFTGASKAKKGLFEEADGGTIFLDELGEMDLALQAKLLRVLEDGSFMRVGTTTEVKVDVRLIAATNRDLLAEAESKKFRLDLYYRLSTFAISLPSLAERASDVQELARHFIETLAPSVNPRVTGMDRDFEQALLRKQWRGNVRELRNFIERTLILAHGPRLGAKDVPFDFDMSVDGSSAGDGVPGPQTLDQLPAIKMADVERLHIDRVMTMTDGNKSRTAELLGIGLTTLYRQLDEYGLKGRY